MDESTLRPVNVAICGAKDRRALLRAFDREGCRPDPQPDAVWILCGEAKVDAVLGPGWRNEVTALRKFPGDKKAQRRSSWEPYCVWVSEKGKKYVDARHDRDSQERSRGFGRTQESPDAGNDQGEEEGAGKGVDLNYSEDRVGPEPDGRPRRLLLGRWVVTCLHPDAVRRSRWTKRPSIVAAVRWAIHLADGGLPVGPGEILHLPKEW